MNRNELTGLQSQKAKQITQVSTDIPKLDCCPQTLTQCLLSTFLKLEPCVCCEHFCLVMLIRLWLLKFAASSCMSQPNPKTFSHKEILHKGKDFFDFSFFKGDFVSIIISVDNFAFHAITHFPNTDICQQHGNMAFGVLSFSFHL